MEHVSNLEEEDYTVNLEEAFMACRCNLKDVAFRNIIKNHFKFFHFFKPFNMAKELELVSEGKMGTIEYILKWTGLSTNLQPEVKKPRRQKPGQAPSIENFQQAAGV